MATFEISTGSKEKYFDRFVRFGLASKGAVYCVMGILTVLTAFGMGGRKGDKATVFQFIYEQPFGKVLLILIGLGLLGFVALRFVQSVRDTDNKGNNVKGLVTRVGFAISAFLYLGFSIYALRLAMDNPSSGDSRQFIVAKVMEWPMGEWVIGIVAAIVAISGLNQLYKGISGKFMKKVTLVRSGLDKIFRKAGLIGYVARGVVFLILGYFLAVAAAHSNPKQAQGTKEAFDFIQGNFGNVLMGIVAVGLVGYGVFMFIRARYERIHLR